MGLTEQVFKHLSDERKALKLRELAKMHNVDVSYIGHILRADRPCAGISLGVFDRMFPNASIDLSGRGFPSVIASGAGSAAASDGAIAVAGGSSLHEIEVFRHRLIDAFLEADLEAVSLKKALGIIHRA